MATRTAHAGAPAIPPEPGGFRPHNPPIYQTTAFEYDDAAGAEQAAESLRHLYVRDGGPTDEALAHAVAHLEGAEAALVFSSGMGAIAAALEALLTDGGAPGHLIAIDGLYGRTHELITSILPRFGIGSTLVAAATPEAVAPAIAATTRAVYVESISNPLLRIADVDGLAALCRERGVALLVDATFATPILQRPLERGATLSIHSATKYLGGHGDALSGVVSGARAELAKVQRFRSIHGASPDPFASWLVLRGLRTLAIRLERQVASAERIARALEGAAGVERVWHPALASHPDRAIAARNLEGGGAMVSFEVSGGLDGARRLYDRIRLIGRAASLGDVRSLMTHPARFSHLRVDPESRRRAGIADGLVRLSVGIEDADDLLDDLRQSLGP